MYQASGASVIQGRRAYLDADPRRHQHSVYTTRRGKRHATPHGSGLPLQSRARDEIPKLETGHEADEIRIPKLQGGPTNSQDVDSNFNDIP
jgi:hypothetical protein